MDTFNSREAAAFRAIGFDAAEYRRIHDDVDQGVELGDELLHLCRWGLREGRRAPVPGPLADVLPRIRSLWPDPLRRRQVVRAVLRARCASLSEEPLTVEAALDLLAAQRAFQPVIVVGGSHGQIYGGPDVVDDLLVLHFATWGGSARGLSNLNARSGYGEIVRAFLDRLKGRLLGPPPPLLFQFGQVDVEFVYNFRRVSSGRRSFERADFDAFCAETVSLYAKYLSEVRAAWAPGRVYAAGIFPPA